MLSAELGVGKPSASAALGRRSHHPLTLSLSKWEPTGARRPRTPRHPIALGRSEGKRNAPLSGAFRCAGEGE